MGGIFNLILCPLPHSSTIPDTNCTYYVHAIIMLVSLIARYIEGGADILYKTYLYLYKTIFALTNLLEL